MMTSLPASDLIEAGIRDLSERRETVAALLVSIGAPKLRSLGTVAALLVSIGAPKLRSLGISIPDPLPSNPEHRLYDLLATANSDSAHSRYNALIRKLVSFERAIPCVRK